MSRSAASLQLSQVSLSLGGAPVLQDIHLALTRGEILVLLGPSGSGKTTLLRLMAGLLQPDQGQVRLNGSPPRPGIGNATVFQNYRLLPWKTVAENIAFALPELPPAARAARVSAVLDLVGLSRVHNAWPRALSGGMRQRVALARALAPHPDFLLMDEPFAALDAQTRELMQFELLRLIAGPDAPGVIFVTHSVDEALLLGDRIILLSARPARVEARITPPFAAPRGQNDPREHPAWADLRRDLWSRLSAAVLDDPNSDFHRADLHRAADHPPGGA